MSIDTDGIAFTGVTNTNGVLLPDSAHHNSKAGRHFHKKLIKDLQGVKTTIEAK